MKPLLTTLALLASTLVARPTTEAQTHEGSYTVQDSLNAIRWASQKWGTSYWYLLKIARCESGLRSDASNGQDFGLMQFAPGTFYEYARRIGETRSYWSPWASANVASFMIGRLGLSYEWSCA